MQELEFQKLIKRAWIQFIAGAIISLAVILWVVKIMYADVFGRLVSEVNLHHEVLTQQIEKFEREESRLLKMLVENEDLEEFVRQNSSDKEVTKLFYNVVRAQESIMQLRFIDTNGLERVRIDQDRASHVTIVPQTRLQNKVDRYYVNEFFKLSRGEVGYSKFDLNEEHGKVDTPYNPTLRMGKGVYVGERLVGVVVINFYMESWIESIMKNSHIKLAIVNEAGDFMMHHDPQWAWSAYALPPKKATQHPLIEFLPDFLENKKPYYKMGYSLIAKEITLFSNRVLVVYEFDKPLNAIIIDKLLLLVGIVVFAFFALLLPLLYLVYRYVQLTNQNSVFLKNVLDNMFDALIVIDKNAIIKHANIAAEVLFCTSQEELVGTNVNKLIPHFDDETQSIIGKERKLYGVDKYGKEFSISLSVKKFTINQKSYCIGTIRDLTPLEELQRVTKEQEALLIYQSKLAAMGEMIGAIAHQWRQPLNELSIRIQKLKYSHAQQKIDEVFIESFIEKNKATIEFMSRTIDGFRNFFRVDKEKMEFGIKQSIEEVLEMLSSQLQNSGIELEFFGEEFRFYGLKTEFQQVIINVIGNSKDAFLEKSTKDPKIKIVIAPLKITIEDNAGGMLPEVLERAFEPYFTTKEQGKGTGMGLYMSKMIIEENMGGRVFMENTKSGVLITIDLRECGDV